jgi:hypothetical protein
MKEVSWISIAGTAMLTPSGVPNQMTDTVVRVEEERQGDDEFTRGLQPHGEIWRTISAGRGDCKRDIPWMAEMTCAESMAGKTGWSRYAMALTYSTESV